ncbi:MFS transporter [Heliorestis acidaminivorans]|uniref:MFS transporter n=1 Tax=Heliorestis acidaminivorans TaxID=553427 RepID=A0A6I0EPS8_9FIRM|nr:LuxR family transcriptional regulator [Heliorestis acidaminivorans]KAB2951967.1 MFS transporter [Heliorestis acidaminivorans]
MSVTIKNLPKSFRIGKPNFINQKTLQLLGFSLFFGWLLAVPFEGQVLYQLVDQSTIEGTNHNMVAILAHFLGLLISGFFIKKQIVAKRTMITATLCCIVGSLVFFLPFSNFWYIALTISSFFAGLFVASWGYFFKIYASPRERLRIAADVIICSNLIMILINVLAVNASPMLALAVAITGLLGALFLSFRLEDSSIEKRDEKAIEGEKTDKKVEVHPKKAATVLPLLLLSLFILIITINSGLMYQVVTPAFSHFPVLTSYYWALPYIVALLILRKVATKRNLAYILYVALAMIGISYLLFMLLDSSISSYLLINTLMLGAFGVFDLFWWSILGSLLEYYENPVQVWGIGLSMNVLGILLGGLVGNLIIDGATFEASIIALVIVLTVIIILPILNNQMARILKSHAFLMTVSHQEEKKQDEALLELKEKKQLTERESEVVQLLLRGYTYKAISKSLNISDNTIKYHAKNIYQKLQINSKMELIKLFAKEEKEKL